MRLQAGYLKTLPVLVLDDRLEELARETYPVPLCSPEIPHKLTRNQTQAATVEASSVLVKQKKNFIQLVIQKIQFHFYIKISF
jgi:hypothetical protein